jgi:hypothetical protein
VEPEKGAMPHNPCNKFKRQFQHQLRGGHSQLSAAGEHCLEEVLSLEISAAMKLNTFIKMIAKPRPTEVQGFLPFSPPVSMSL